ncbi:MULTISPECIES: response regulator transcription factor [unclassified Paenibacillus]|uniref:response regulator transcription factor n=1 Tax=unclassified Paenibacillus TaxID=185978 RepID=UPI0007BF98DA|nr:MULTISPECIES: response regulator transcription factor [unclassified Paenibacillus]SHN79830.1 DNA-binding response regulator, OmpR family, contains REC and winged-helix (wHTH) domain [Paenibacillus sp. ov031]SLK08371.1 DNA-binding response regulator, OmpR family, contains REC and winged-helix (wHTH) domain [Paenibacillus sp. RU5A]SOC71027.1 DNA-binding response regulator, OmpR family, contains REC and winged-helix (wHTH) domain [Paenibacillus sp. RU26A]SOC73508.1 DNA-binding response regulato
MNLLLADDEPLMLQILKAYFVKEGFQVFLAEDGEAALNLFYNNQIDLAVLDWMMPGRSGVEVCREIKRTSRAKVLLLTAKGESDDEFLALKAGADDYLRKPFDSRILLLRVKKLLQLSSKIIVGELTVDLEGQKVYRRGVDVGATHKEFELMKVLGMNKGQIVTRKILLDQVWGFDYFGEERTVDTHIRRLREKIGEDSIKTYRGMGYCLEDQDE